MRIFILITVMLVACNNRVQNTSSEDDSVKKAKDLEAEIMELAKPAYIKAFTEVNELRAEIQSADSGLIDKANVVEKYNSNVGLTIGYLDDFDSVKKRIADAGDIYITAMHKKEAARIAMEKAAEMKFEIDKIKNQ
jgi:hypothetical protein